ncbi:MAG: potassium channel family protein [Gammaproteobacteria bacterium]
MATKSRWQECRYTILLGLIMVFLLGWPLASNSTYPLLAQAFGSGLLLAILISAAMATGSAVQWRVILGLAAAVIMALNLGAYMTSSVALEIAFYVSTLSFLGVIAALTIRHLMRQQSADNDTLASALCAYAVLVLFWASAYSLLETMVAGSFNYSGAAADVPQLMHFGFGDSMMSIYYSFVTITTLGYGDVTPVTSFARMLAALQAFLGQAFVAILVARLVGLKLAESLSSDQS